MSERKTYQSKDATYELDPAKLFNVVADMEIYTRLAKSQAVQENPPEVFKPAASFRGEGKTLVISTEALCSPGIRSSFNLAELVLKDGALTLITHAHPQVTIPSDYLADIGQGYAKK